jgi:ribosomal protein L13
MLATKPDEIIRLAVRRMLPKNQQGRGALTRLYVFPDDNHPFRENIAKRYEDLELDQLNAQAWSQMTTEDILKLNEMNPLEK